MAAKGAEDLVKLQGQFKNVKDAHTVSVGQATKLQNEKDALEHERQRLVTTLKNHDRDNMNEKQQMHKHIEELQAALERMKKESRAIMEQMNRQVLSLLLLFCSRPCCLGPILYCPVV